MGVFGEEGGVFVLILEGFRGWGIVCFPGVDGGEGGGGEGIGMYAGRSFLFKTGGGDCGLKMDGGFDFFH